MKLMKQILSGSRNSKFSSKSKAKNRKIEKERESSLIPGLLDDVARLCLARIPFVTRGSARCVSRTWQKYLSSPDLYRIRASQNLCDELLCICLGDTYIRGKRSIVFQIFDIQLQTYCYLPPLLTPWLNCFTEHVGYKCIHENSSFIVVGGSTYSRIHGIDVADGFGCAWKFDFITNKWDKLPERLCPPRIHPAVTIVSGQLLVIGSNDPRPMGSAKLPPLEILDVEKGRWSLVRSFPGGNDSPVWCVPSLSSSNRVLVTAGRHTFSFNIETGNWSDVDDMCDKAVLRMPTPGSPTVTVNGELISVAHLHGKSWRPPNIVRLNRKSEEWEEVGHIVGRDRKSWEESSRYFLHAVKEKVYVLETWIDFHLLPGGEGTFVEVAMTRLHRVSFPSHTGGTGNSYTENNCTEVWPFINLKVAAPIRSAFAISI